MVVLLRIVGQDGYGAVRQQRALAVGGDQDQGQAPFLCQLERGQIPGVTVDRQEEQDRVLADRPYQAGEQAAPFHQDGWEIQGVQDDLQVAGRKGA